MRTRLLAAFWVLLPWLGLFAALIPTWEGGVYYGYGYVVPLLAYILVYARISDSAGMPPVRLSFWWWSVVVIGLLMIALGGILECLDPLWRRPLWSHAAGCLLLSILALYALGGWKRVFAAAGCGVFLLTALPLPFFIEYPLVAHLSDMVARLAAYGLNLLGIPVIASGTVLMGTHNSVGVEETCSGLRSIQAGIMLALFFGEWYRLRFSRRLVLVLIALVASVVANAFRVIWLAREGLAGTGEISGTTHDTTGALAFAASVVAILVGALWLSERQKESLAWIPQWKGRDIVRPLAIGLTASVLPFLAATAWFGFSQVFPVTGPQLKLPEQVSGRILRMDPAVTGASKLLHYDRAQLARYVFNREEWLDLLVLDYDAVNSRSWTELLVHGPEVCMPAMGLQSGSVLEKGLLTLNGEPWNLEKFRFKEPHSGKIVYVFRLVWWGGGEIARQEHLQARWNALMRHHRINWSTHLVLGAVVLSQPDENRAYETFISVMETLPKVAP